MPNVLERKKKTQIHPDPGLKAFSIWDEDEEFKEVKLMTCPQRCKIGRRIKKRPISPTVQVGGGVEGVKREQLPSI